MKLKNIVLTFFKRFVLLFVVLGLTNCSSILPLANNNLKEEKTYNIKSTTNPFEIKKTLLSKKIIKNKLLPKFESYKFNLNSDDLKRTAILNLINGPDNTIKANRLMILLNGKMIVEPLNINEFDDLNFEDLKNKYCKANNINQANPKFKEILQKLFNTTFNSKTSELSLPLSNLKQGENKLDIMVIGRPSSTINLNIDGFLKPIDIPNAVFSNVPDDNFARQHPHTKGKIMIKFLEGMKVRLTTNSNGTQKLTDSNGISLTSLERLMNQISVKSITRSTTLTPEEIDQEEIKVEEYWGKDVPNKNLMYNLDFDINLDVWSVVDQLRQLPFIEEASPDFTMFESAFVNYDSDLKLNFKDKDQTPKSKWLDVAGIPDAWFYSNFIKESVNVAIIDTGTAEHEDLRNIKKDNFYGNFVNTNNFYNYNHGTKTAGIVGATHNGIGTQGIAKNQNIIAVRAYESDSKGVIFDTCRRQTEALEHALALKSNKALKGLQAKVIILETSALGFTAEQTCPSLRATILSAVLYGANVIVPAGNLACDPQELDKCSRLDGVNIGFMNTNRGTVPTPDTGSIIVGGLHLDGNIMNIKRGGTTYNFNNGISIPADKDGKKDINGLYTEMNTFSGGHATDVSAPAEKIYTTLYDKDILPEQESNKYTEDGFAGTSGAAPIVGSVVALIHAYNPNLSPLTVRKILRDTRKGTSLIAGMIDPGQAFSTIHSNYNVPKTDTLRLINNVLEYSYLLIAYLKNDANFSPSIANTITNDNFVIASANDKVGIGLAGNVDNLKISVNDIEAEIVDNIPGYTVFKVPAGTGFGAKSLKITSDGGSIDIKNALDISSSSIELNINPNALNKILTIGDYSYGYSLVSYDFITLEQKTLSSTNNTNTMAWSPDKSKIAFSQGYGIYTMNYDSTERILISNKYAYYIKYSPDGSKIAFTSYGDDSNKLNVMNSDGSNNIELDSLIYDDGDFSWSNDSSKIVYRISNSIYTIKSDGTNKTLLLSESNNNIYKPQFLKGDSRILYLYNGNIYTMNLDGSAKNNITNFEYDSGELRERNQISLSPDGNKIGFIESAGGFQVGIMNLDGSNLILFPSFNLDYGLTFSWSPDSKKVVFCPDSNYESIYTANVDGTNITKLATRFRTSGRNSKFSIQNKKDGKNKTQIAW